MARRRQQTRHGLLIDIGSGSVGYGIVVSDPKKSYPELVFSERQMVPVREIENIKESSKPIISTLTDMALVIPNTGLQALREFTGSNKSTIDEVQVTVAAPWSYTVSRPVRVEKEDSFAVTLDLIHDLGVAAGDEAMRTFNEEFSEVVPDVIETSRGVLDAYANGYRLPTINKQKTTTLSLTHTATLINADIFLAVGELQQKLFPGAQLHTTSSILSFYYATRQLIPHVYDLCLVDITDEATEIGIVRDGSLTYCTHTPFGGLALAREIAAATKRPLGEVAARLSDLIDSETTADIDQIMTAYQKKVEDLFTETGDALTIPRTVYLLAENQLLEVLAPTITAAGTKASKTKITLHSIKELLQSKSADHTATDYSLASAGRFFHTQAHRPLFEYL